MLAVVIIEACTSGKAALKHGAYYEAVLESTKRLRESPTNKKATEVLTTAYPLAVEFIETGIQNGIKADDPRKWRNAVDGYGKINFLNDQIKTSLGAMKLITNPQTRFKELADAKEKAAEEVYNEGVNFMMKATRPDYKSAYFDFKEANDYKQGYRESIEMMTQAEFNATLRVAFEEINNSNVNYGTFQPVVSSLGRLFLSFKPIAQKDTVPPQQYLRIIFNGYQQDFRPTVSSRSEEQTKQIKVGETKGPDGKPKDVMETVKAKVTFYTKRLSANSTANVTITDAANNSTLQQLQVNGGSDWNYDWATFSGDGRALGGSAPSLVQRKEVSPTEQDVKNLYSQSMSNLRSNLGQQLKSFYAQY